MQHSQALSRIAGTLFTLFLLLLSPMGMAQEADIMGEWRGTYNINIGGDRAIVFTLVEKDGVLTGTFDDATSGILGVNIEKISHTGRDVRFSIPRIAGEYFGTIHRDLGTDGKPVRIDGDWSHAGEFIPITLLRTP